MSYFGSNEWYAQVAQGLIPGHSLVHKYGRDPDGAISTESPVCQSGIMNFLSAASTVRIKSGGNAADTAAGAGAREVTVEGVDGSGLFASEAIATAGASASSATSTSFFRVYRAYVSSSGTYVTTGISTSGTNQGAVVIENSAGGTDLITIAQYEGQTQYAGYAVATDQTAYLLSAIATVDSSKVSDVKMYVRNAYTDTSAPVKARRLKLYFDGVAGQVEYNPKTPLTIGTGCDVWWTHTPTANGTECAVNFEMLIVDN